MPWINKPKKKPYITDRKREERQEIYQTQRWKTIREAKLMNNPLCEVCEIEGRITLATEVHHLQTFLDGMTEQERKEIGFNPSNLLSVCRNCHTSKLHNRGIYEGCLTVDEIKERFNNLNKKV